MSGLTPEQSLQITCVQWWYACVVPGHAWMTAVNPASAKSKAVAGLSKAMGLVPGVADLLILYRQDDAPPQAAWVELKTRYGALNERQRAFRTAMKGMSVEYHVARSLDEFRALVRDTLGIPTREAA